MSRGSRVMANSFVTVASKGSRSFGSWRLHLKRVSKFSCSSETHNSWGWTDNWKNDKGWSISKDNVWGETCKTRRERDKNCEKKWEETYHILSHSSYQQPCFTTVFLDLAGFLLYILGVWSIHTSTRTHVRKRTRLKNSLFTDTIRPTLQLMFFNGTRLIRF